MSEELELARARAKAKLRLRKLKKSSSLKEDSSFDSSDEQEKMSYLETLGLKIGEGASLGATDVLSGGIGAAIDAITPESDVDKKLKEQGFKLPEESLLDSYRSARDYSKRLQEKSAEDNPKLSLVADIAGGAMMGSGIGKIAQGSGKIANLAKALPGGKKLKTGGDIVKESVKAGALTGIFKGDADITKGEVSEAGKDIAVGSGAGLAGTLGLGVLAKTPKAIGAVGKTLLGGKRFDAARRLAKKGVDVFDENQVDGVFNEVSEDIRDKINNIFSDNDKFKMNALLDEAGIKIKAGKPVREAFDEVFERGVSDPSEAKSINEFAEYLDTLLTKKSKEIKKLEQSIEKSAAQKANKVVRAGGEVETRTEFDTPIEDIVPLPEYKGSVKGVQDRISFRDEEGKKILKDIVTQKTKLEDLVPVKIPDIENLTPTQLDEVITTLKKYAGPDANPSVRGTAIKLQKSLKEIRDGVGDTIGIEDIAEQYKNLSRGFSAKKMIGKFDNTDAGRKKMAMQIKSMLKSGEGTQQSDKIKASLEYLKEADPKAYQEAIEGTSILKDIQQIPVSDREGFGFKTANPFTAFGNITPAQVKAGQITGSVQKKVSDKVISGTNYLKKLADNTYLTKVYNKLGKLKGPVREEYSNVLEKLNAEDTPDRTKNAIIMGLMQQPAFRKLLEDVDRGAEDGEQEN